MSTFPLWTCNANPEVITTPQTVQSGPYEITKAGAANTKSNWTQLNAATSRAYSGFMVQFGNNGNGQEVTTALVDLAFGTTVIVSNILAFNDLIDFSATPIFFPIGIPEGTQIQARLQQRVVQGAPAIEMWGFPFDPQLPAPYGRVTTYGANTGDSGGVLVDCGSVTNTKTRTTIATTTNPIRHMILCIGDAGVSVRQQGKILFDVEIGTTNRIVYQGLYLRSTQEESVHPMYFQIPISIPSGTPIKINAQCDSSNASARTFDVVILGID